MTAHQVTTTREVDLVDSLSLVQADDRALQDAVREFCDGQLRPHVKEWYESQQLPDDLGLQLGRLGVLGMHLTGYGCAGVSSTAYGLACMELEAVDSAFRSFVSVQGSLAMYSIHRFGSEEQKNEWLPRMAAGEVVGCFGLTEPESGSNPAGMTMRASQDGSDWILTGQKMWITNGSLADVATVWATTPDGVRGFLVPRGTRGFLTQDIGGKLSLQMSRTSTLFFDDVRLPAEAQLPHATGLGAPLSCLNEARMGITFGALGAARDSLEVALKYSRERHQFGRPIGSFQLTQKKLADMSVEVSKGLLLAPHLARLKDMGRLRFEQISVGKLNNVREALAIARMCRTILGAAGITVDYSPLRHANNLESVLTYEGTSEVHTLILGEALTGERALT